MSTVRAPAAPVLVQDSLDGLEQARSVARAAEGRLDPIEQKMRGQYFTSMAVARVLAALSIRPGCQDIIDPMAGHGALLDAALERASLLALPIRHVAAIEINPTLADACRTRIAAWREYGVAGDVKVHAASAFDPGTVGRLQPDGFDLVIGNPPYVRYQSTANGRSTPGQVASDVRDGLDAIAAERAPSAERDLWRSLIRAYSGLADLSVPAWLLSGLLVKPGGVLALVVPATWRSRNYADVIQYLMQRCFRLERVVADGRARWFSSALVRTELIVATRLPTADAAVPLRRRPELSEHVAAAEITEAAANEASLVGRAFPTDDSERAFAAWLLESNPSHRDGIRLRRTPAARLGFGINSPSPQWARDLEGVSGPDLFNPAAAAANGISVPDQLADFIPDAVELRSLSDYGIEVGQGLRTGCNEFFYVDFVDSTRAGFSKVRTSPVLGGHIIEVPDEVLQPVLRRQTDLAGFAAGKKPSGRVLDLSGFALPEDLEMARQFRATYASHNEPLPHAMPSKLAEFVRRAATTKHGHLAMPIAELSAVRTNTRPGSGKATPRYWYMLPAFVRRHRPDAFVARVNTGTPTVYVNRSRPILIDANFSTLWSGKRAATMIAPLLNSSWARACMEAMGTVLGGGALKLEATHLRRLPLPLPSARDLAALSSATDAETVDRILYSALLGRQIAPRELWNLQDRIREAGERLRVQRQPR